MSATALRPLGGSLLPPAGRGRRRIAVVVVALLVLAAVATWLVAFSSVFGVDAVRVHGARTISAGTVERAAKVTRGQPTVRVDTDAIARRVERLPQVASARVTTSFPATVTIDVTERVAVGYVQNAGRRTLVDRTGRWYLGVDKTPAGLPRLVVPAGGGTIAAGSALATVARSLSAQLRTHTVSIQALDPSAITVVLRGRKNGTDGTVLVQWGSAARSGDKAAVAEVLRTRKGVDRIDVSNPDQPFTS